MRDRDYARPLVVERQSPRTADLPALDDDDEPIYVVTGRDVAAFILAAAAVLALVALARWW